MTEVYLMLIQKNKCLFVNLILVSGSFLDFKKFLRYYPSV